MKVATKRLLKEQIAAVVVLGRGEKNDAMWHVTGRMSLQLLHDSRTTANVKMLQSGLKRVSQIPRQLSVCLASGISSAHMGDWGQATLDLWQLSVCLQHRRGDHSPLKW